MKDRLFKKYLLNINTRREVGKLTLNNPIVKKIKSYNQFSSKDIQNNYRTIMNKNFELSLYCDPKTVLVEYIATNTNCNLNCLMCNKQLSTRKTVTMDPVLFEKVILEIIKKIGSVKIVLSPIIGEPLINPYLEDYLKILRKHRIRVFRLFTNAQLLHEKLDVICKYADIIETLLFSVDGATKETYEKIRRPGKFDKLITNLELFKKVNKDGKHFKKVRMYSIVSTDTQEELAYHLKFYSQYVPMVNIDLHLVNGGCNPDHTYFLNKSILKKHIVPNRPCYDIFRPISIRILSDGNITACSRDYNGDLIYGNILNNKLEEIINSEKIIQLRKYHIDNQIPLNILCDKCYILDHRVSELFRLFTSALIHKNFKKWDVKEMQKKFNQFFVMFKDKIPKEDEFLSLFKHSNFNSKPNTASNSPPSSPS